MPLSSMTGFARATGSSHGLSWQWELRSVNGKSLDMRLRLPPGYEHLEPATRMQISAALKRGNVQASLSVDSANSGTDVIINETVLARLTARARALQTELDGPPLQAELLLGLRGVVEATQHHVTESDRLQVEATLETSLQEALSSLVGMRRAEGQRLHSVLLAQVDMLAQLSTAIRNHPARSPDAIRDRLREQVQRLVETSSSLEPERLHQEVLILATRNDIQEELDRLDSHVAAARDLLRATEPVGRKFEFLAQEFNREANTICSKANDKHVTALALDLKTVIDQLREQVQNIE